LLWLFFLFFRDLLDEKPQSFPEPLTFLHKSYMISRCTIEIIKTSKGDSMEEVTLKNGSKEADVLVAATMVTLRDLINKKPIIFYELVMKCRKGDDHKFFGNSEKDLKALSLVENNGSIHNSIRNVVLSAVTGEDLGMVLGDPYARS
jgi:hypothetical protein